MKTTHASLLAVVSLSLALCACDSGDKKDTGSAPPTVTKNKPKADGGEAKANPQPPEPGEASKSMNESAAPAAAVDPGTANASGVETINGAIKVYNQKKSAELMGKSGAMAGGAGAKDQYLAKFKKGPSAGSVVGVTSLDQLVTAKVLKSIPEPPAGKKYVLDTQKQEVRLENK